MGPSWSFGRSSKSLKNHWFFCISDTGGVRGALGGLSGDLGGLFGRFRVSSVRRGAGSGVECSMWVTARQLRNTTCGMFQATCGSEAILETPQTLQSSITVLKPMVFNDFNFHEGVPRALSVALGRSWGGVMWVPGSCLGRLGRSWGVGEIIGCPVGRSFGSLGWSSGSLGGS